MADNIPHTYIAKRISNEMNANRNTRVFPNWDQAIVLNEFTYPWPEERAGNITFRALWNDFRFYFRFDVLSSDVKVFSETNHKMEVIESDRVEIFFRTDSNLNPYYCLEMDPLGRMLDYRARYYRQFEYNWQWPDEDQIGITASVSEAGYAVEGSISMASLNQLSLLTGHELQAGLYRGECTGITEKKGRFKWISWVKPESEKPDFHIPSSFGVIKLQE
jgi:hypothetical protein